MLHIDAWTDFLEEFTAHDNRQEQALAMQLGMKIFQAFDPFDQGDHDDHFPFYILHLSYICKPSPHKYTFPIHSRQ